MTKSDTNTALRFRRAARAIDAHMSAIYGHTFQEFLDLCFKLAFELGFEKGRREGRAEGRRAAKGLKEKPKKRGRPPKIDESLRSLLVQHVDARERGEPIGEAVRSLLSRMRRGRSVVSANRAPRATYEAAGIPYKDHARTLPTQEQAKGAYFREARKAKIRTELPKSGGSLSK